MPKEPRAKCDECPICLETKRLAEKYKCSHKICNECFLKWPWDCPYCRKETPPSRTWKQLALRLGQKGNCAFVVELWGDMIHLKISVPEKGKEKWMAVAYSNRSFEFSPHDLAIIKKMVNRFKRGDWAWEEEKGCFRYETPLDGEAVYKSVEDMMVGFVKKIHPSMTRRGVTARFNKYKHLIQQ